MSLIKPLDKMTEPIIISDLTFENISSDCKCTHIKSDIFNHIFHVHLSFSSNVVVLVKIVQGWKAQNMSYNVFHVHWIIFTEVVNWKTMNLLQSHVAGQYSFRIIWSSDTQSSLVINSQMSQFSYICGFTQSSKTKWLIDLLFGV